MAITDYQHEQIDKNLKSALALATNAQATYITAPDPLRRQLNQALFSRIKIDDAGDVTSELAPPFNIILGPDARALAKSHEDSEPGRQALQQVPEPREISPQDGDAHLVGASGRSWGPTGVRPGLNYETLVDLAGQLSKLALLSARPAQPSARA